MSVASPIVCTCGHDYDLHDLVDVHFGESKSEPDNSDMLGLYWRFRCRGQHNAVTWYPLACACVNFKKREAPPPTLPSADTITDIIERAKQAMRDEQERKRKDFDDETRPREGDGRPPENE